MTGPVVWSGLGLAALLFAFAAIVWVIEHRRNPDHFGGGVMQGMGHAVWWSASTMSTSDGGMTCVIVPEAAITPVAMRMS